MSTSEHWRKSGNDIFKSADQIFMQNGWEEKMKEAIICYKKAMNTAVHDKERASAAKNTALAAIKVAEFLATVPDREKSTIENYCLGIQSLVSALTFGQKYNEPDWVTHLKGLRDSTLKDALQSLKHIPLGLSRLFALRSFEASLPSGEWKNQVRYEIAQAAFKSAVVAIENKNHKSALDYLKTCEGPLRELDQFMDGDADIEDLPGFFEKVTKSGIDTLKTGIRLHQNQAEALQCIERGDKCLKEATSEQEALHMGTVWQAVDFYQNASILAEDISVEYEARAHSRLGRVMFLVLKWPIRAREYFNSAMNLIHSRDLKRLMTTEWYEEMKTMHSKAQDDCYKEEEEREHLETKDIKRQLKKELDILDDISAKGAMELLEYIYHRYPPKDENMKLAYGFEDDLTKALRNASIHYHPDKIDESMHGKRWKVTSGEIVKRVNTHYDRIKLK